MRRWRRGRGESREQIKLLLEPEGRVCPGFWLSLKWTDKDFPKDFPLPTNHPSLPLSSGKGGHLLSHPHPLHHFGLPPSSMKQLKNWDTNKGLEENSYFPFSSLPRFTVWLYNGFFFSPTYPIPDLFPTPSSPTPSNPFPETLLEPSRSSRPFDTFFLLTPIPEVFGGLLRKTVKRYLPRWTAGGWFGSCGGSSQTSTPVGPPLWSSSKHYRIWTWGTYLGTSRSLLFQKAHWGLESVVTFRIDPSSLLT